MFFDYFFFDFFFFTAFGVPTSVDFVRCDTSQITVGFSSADVAVYDLETAKKVITLDSRLPSGKVCDVDGEDDEVE